MNFINRIIDCDILVFTGPPLCGKTYLYNLIKEYKDYTRVSEKINQAQALIMGRYALACGNNIIIDRKNCKISHRECWIKLAREFNKSIGIVSFVLDIQECETRLRRDLKILQTPAKMTDKEIEYHIVDMLADFYSNHQPVEIAEIDKFDYSLILTKELIKEDFLKKVI